MKKRVMIAGSTGYLGRYLIESFSKEGYEVVALARSPKKLWDMIHQINDVREACVTQAETLVGTMKDIDYVVSTVGITRQKDGLTYMDVDYQGNMNLLEEALKAGVEKFMYISALNGAKLTHIKIGAAKEKFVDALEKSNIESYIIRPNGFFSDIEEIYAMAEKGRVFLFGGGRFLSNPIHGADLALFCSETMEEIPGQYDIGGPVTMSQKAIAELAFESIGKSFKMTSIPVWVAKMAKWLLRHFSKESFYGPIEFFLTVLTMTMKAPEYGSHTLEEHFEALSK